MSLPSYSETMTSRRVQIRVTAVLMLAVAIITHQADAQSPPETPPTPTIQSQQSADPAAKEAVRPLPDINTLMRQVELQQKASLVLVKNYIYRSNVVSEELDSHGNPKKTEQEEREHFWINDTPISRLLQRDGKILSESDQKKEKDRIDKRIAEAKEIAQKKADGETAHRRRGEYEVTFARFLELGAFSNPRRVIWHGRDTIAVDYHGDPKAKTNNPVEGVIHELAGTVWIDEVDHALVRLEAQLFNDFKLGGGLVANIHKDSSFQTEFMKVNGEIWLPASISAKGSARFALFYRLNGTTNVTNFGYRRFKATSTILPEVTPVTNPEAPPDASPSTNTSPSPPKDPTI